MATAVDSSTKNSTPAASTASPALTGTIGAAFLLAGIFVAGYVIPQFWKSVAPNLGGFIDVALRLIVQIAAVFGLVWVGTRLAGQSPPRGTRGGIFLAICCAFIILFITRAFGLNLETSSTGLPITLIVLGGLLYGSFKLMTSPRGTRWMYTLEDQGWFHTFSHKPLQGLRTRRWTLITLLIIGGTGVFSLHNQSLLPSPNWQLKIPFTNGFELPLLTDSRYSGPVILGALALWIAWRAVNIPTFADFLIATDAEINKVSWTPWKKLIRDTIVVLVFTALLTGFLLVVDVFWGWFLSHKYVGVLPSKSTTQQVNPAEQKKDW